MSYSLEICANSIQSALNAQTGGASRIEFCDNILEGGTTPSYGAIKQVVEHLTIPVFVLIRPRGGDFVYSDEEFAAMKDDIQFCKEIGCRGIVTGILKADGTVDVQRTTKLVELAKPLQLTFHRAFDDCVNMDQSLEDIIQLGFDRILTSGGKPTAFEAISTLSELVKKADNRIKIVPGSGITETNIIDIATATGAEEFHTTAKTLRQGVHYSMFNDETIVQTDTEKVRAISKILNSLDSLV
ncbi:copper homeostasis protein CutC [Pedobacter sp. HMF7647]|uniref:PF03932 family protein CutC n=1 Tax=Hufsiella arboris TaxID=2695275 RepID=A0A7K1YC31_9SPHI|nr:copper homeostasis protein CutC [Hufsiella arboris]MXV51598.1 copper homeostasis protein CutC [Hufsiella arboris]